MRLTASGHFVSDRAGDDHHIRLPRGKAHDLGAEAGDVETAGARGHEFDGATGQPHRHGPEGVLAEPVNGRIQASVDHIAFDLRIIADFSFGLHDVLQPRSLTHAINIRRKNRQADCEFFHERGDEFGLLPKAI